MEIKGKFFPVGHGLTYAFKVDSTNVLFDIKKSCNFSELAKFFGQKSIDILIISHFDADHADGVQALYSQGYRIKAIYIPYIGRQSETIMHFIFQCRGQNYSAVIENLERHDTRIIEVAERQEIRCLRLWRFTIHQSEGAPQKIAQIISNLNAIGIRTRADVNKVLATKQPQIKNAYKKVISNLNLTSLFLEHGPAPGIVIAKTHYCGREFISGKKTGENTKTHSLITGDCSLSENKNTISRYVDDLGYILVPHHSGLKEWDSFLCKGTQSAVWVVTISEIKTRPYGKVVRDIYSNREKLYICDKLEPFEYEFCIKVP